MNDVTHPQAAVTGSEAVLGVDRRLSPGWKAVVGGFFGLGLGPNIVLILNFGVFVPALRAEFGWGVGAISIGATIIALTLAVISPLQGRLVDRFGARKMVLIFLPIFGAALASMAMLGPDIRLFYLACFLVTLSALGVWSLTYLAAVSSWFDRRLGLALGVTQVGAGLGGGLVPALIAVVFAAWSWRAGYVVLGALQFVMVPLALWAVHEKGWRGSETAARKAAPPRFGETFKEAARTRGFYLLIGSFLLLGAFNSGVIIHMVSIMIDRGLSYSQAVATHSTLLFSSMIGRLVAGWALDRVRVVVLMPALLIASAVACVLFATGSSTPVLIASAVVIGLTVGAEFDVLGYAIRRYHGMRAFGTIFGVTFGCFMVGSAAGAAMMGLTREATGSYATGLMMLAGLCVASAVTMALLGPYRFVSHDATEEGSRDAEVKPG